MFGPRVRLAGKLYLFFYNNINISDEPSQTVAIVQSHPNDWPAFIC